jgi:hypothetical protein
VTALGTLMRTHALLLGEDTKARDALDEALDGLPIFLDKKYLVRVDKDPREYEDVVVEGFEPPK